MHSPHLEARSAPEHGGYVCRAFLRSRPASLAWSLWARPMQMHLEMSVHGTPMHFRVTTASRCEADAETNHVVIAINRLTPTIRTRPFARRCRGLPQATLKGLSKPGSVSYV